MLNLIRTRSISVTVKRALFTDEFLTVTLAKERQELIIKSIKDNNLQIPKLRQDIIDAVSPSTAIVTPENKEKHKPLLSEDINQLIFTSKTQRQVLT